MTPNELTNLVAAVLDLEDIPSIDAERDLIGGLVAQNIIPSDYAFVEWQGVWEFGHVPVCYFDDKTEKATWICLHRDGSIT